MVRTTDLALLAGRVLIGAIFIVHGAPKLLDAGASEFPAAFALGLGGLEIVAAVLLILGVFTRAVVVPLVGIMLGALALVQLRETGDLPLGVHPALERDLLIMVGLGTLLAFGPGRYALSARYQQLQFGPSPNTTPS